MCHIFYTTAQNNKQPMQTIWVDALLRVTKVCTKCSSPICHSLNLMSQNGGGLYGPRYPHTIPSHKTRGATYVIASRECFLFMSKNECSSKQCLSVRECPRGDPPRMCIIIDSMFVYLCNLPTYSVM